MIMHFSCILLFLCKLFHGIVTMLYSNFHNIVSTISIYLLGNASKKKKKKLIFLWDWIVKVIQIVEKGTMAPLMSYKCGIFTCSYPNC